MRRRLALILTLFFVASAHAATKHTNPFFRKSTLPFQAPHFDKVKDADYKMAIDAGMKQQIAEIDAIANNPKAATFENTIIPMEKSGALLTRVSKVYFNLTHSNTNDAMQKIEAEEAPRLAAHSHAIIMNPKLFARVKTL